MPFSRGLVYPVLRKQHPEGCQHTALSHGPEGRNLILLPEARQDIHHKTVRELACIPLRLHVLFPKRHRRIVRRAQQETVGRKPLSINMQHRQRQKPLNLFHQVGTGEALQILRGPLLQQQTGAQRTGISDEQDILPRGQFVHGYSFAFTGHPDSLAISEPSGLYKKW